MSVPAQAATWVNAPVVASTQPSVFLNWPVESFSQSRATLTQMRVPSGDQNGWPSRILPSVEALES